MIKMHLICLFQAKIWNIRQCKLLFSLIGHNGCVFCVDLDDECKKAFTGSGDRVSTRNILSKNKVK